MSISSPLGPDYHNHPPIKPAHCRISNFTVIEPIIDGGGHFASKDLVRIHGKIDPALLQGYEPFVWIIRDWNEIKYNDNKSTMSKIL